MAVRYLNATGTQALINEIKTRLALKANQSSLATLQSQVQEISASIPTKTSDLENDSEFLTDEQAETKYYTQEAAAALIQVVQQHTDAIATLNADDTTEGSVDYKIKQAISGGGIESISTEEIEALF